MKRPNPETAQKLPKTWLKLRDKILEPAEFDHMNSKFCVAITLSRKLRFR